MRAIIPAPQRVHVEEDELHLGHVGAGGRERAGRGILVIDVAHHDVGDLVVARLGQLGHHGRNHLGPLARDIRKEHALHGGELGRAVDIAGGRDIGHDAAQVDRVRLDEAVLRLRRAALAHARQRLLVSRAGGGDLPGRERDAHQQEHLTNEDSGAGARSMARTKRQHEVDLRLGLVVLPGSARQANDPRVCVPRGRTGRLRRTSSFDYSRSGNLIDVARYAFIRRGRGRIHHAVVDPRGRSSAAIRASDGGGTGLVQARSRNSSSFRVTVSVILPRACSTITLRIDRPDA